ncbi:MAG TPA: YfiR family protein [Polyangia bacterium]|nr:YfiR family protein [Polyangia bacterium]
MVAGLGASVPGSAPGAPKEYQVKAAFLYNFAKFVEWPTVAFEKPQTPYSICVLGTDPFGEDLDIAAAENVQGRRMMVRRTGELRNLGACHILFVSASERRRLPAIFEALGNAPTFTVGEDEDFVRAGGCLRFFVVENKVRFEINLQATERARLKVSAKLLNLARVIGKTPGKD